MKEIGIKTGALFNKLKQQHRLNMNKIMNRVHASQNHDNVIKYPALMKTAQSKLQSNLGGGCPDCCGCCFSCCSNTIYMNGGSFVSDGMGGFTYNGPHLLCDVTSPCTAFENQNYVGGVPIPLYWVGYNAGLAQWSGVQGEPQPPPIDPDGTQTFPYMGGTLSCNQTPYAQSGVRIGFHLFIECWLGRGNYNGQAIDVYAFGGAYLPKVDCHDTNFNAFFSNGFVTWNELGTPNPPYAGLFPCPVIGFPFTATIHGVS